MSKDVTESVEEQSQQITGKSRHVNNKIPDYESFFKGEDLVGNNEGKGFVGRLLNKDKKPIILASFLFYFFSIFTSFFMFVYPFICYRLLLNSLMASLTLTFFPFLKAIMNAPLNLDDISLLVRNTLL